MSTGLSFTIGGITGRNQLAALSSGMSDLFARLAVAAEMDAANEPSYVKSLPSAEPDPVETRVEGAAFALAPQPVTAADPQPVVAVSASAAATAEAGRRKRRTKAEIEADEAAKRATAAAAGDPPPVLAGTPAATGDVFGLSPTYPPVPPAEEGKTPGAGSLFGEATVAAPAAVTLQDVKDWVNGFAERDAGAIPKCQGLLAELKIASFSAIPVDQLGAVLQKLKALETGAAA